MKNILLTSIALTTTLIANIPPAAAADLIDELTIHLDLRSAVHCEFEGPNGGHQVPAELSFEIPQFVAGSPRLNTSRIFGYAAKDDESCATVINSLPATDLLSTIKLSRRISRLVTTIAGKCSEVFSESLHATITPSVPALDGTIIGYTDFVIPTDPAKCLF